MQKWVLSSPETLNELFPKPVVVTVNLFTILRNFRHKSPLSQLINHSFLWPPYLLLVKCLLGSHTSESNILSRDFAMKK